MSTRSQVAELRESVERFRPDHNIVDAQIGEIANALIAATKEQVQDNPVVNAIQPFEMEYGHVVGASAGTIAAVLRQLESALPKPKSTIRIA